MKLREHLLTSAGFLKANLNANICVPKSVTSDSPSALQWANTKSKRVAGFF